MLQLIAASLFNLSHPVPAKASLPPNHFAPNVARLSHAGNRVYLDNSKTQRVMISRNPAFRLTLYSAPDSEGIRTGVVWVLFCDPIPEKSTTTTFRANDNGITEHIPTPYQDPQGVEELPLHLRAPFAHIASHYCKYI